VPHPVPAFERAADVWSAMRAGDILVHHPYHSFDAVTGFVHEAAADPQVLAIKMTLYRVSPASPIAHALRTAVENGKEVAVLVRADRRALRRSRALHQPRRVRRGPHRAVQSPHRLHPAADLPPPPPRAGRAARRARHADPPRDRSRAGGTAGAHHREDERPGGRSFHRGAVRRAPAKRGWRSI
jgi:hypothetical protein